MYFLSSWSQMVCYCIIFKESGPFKPPPPTPDRELNMPVHIGIMRKKYNDYLGTNTSKFDASRKLLIPKQMNKMSSIVSALLFKSPITN